MPVWVADALELALPYWSFLAQLITFWFVGQVVKKRWLTKDRAAGNPEVRVLRSTMPLHPIVAGALWGLAYPVMPAAAFVTTVGEAVTQGMLAGVLSTLAFRALESLAEHREWTWLLITLRETGNPED